jgi:4-hydroxy-L-threonine phosphate dehydrogenase PdxA
LPYTLKIDDIIPSIEKTRIQSISAQDFISPDIAFYSAAMKQELDVVVFMVHGQGHIPLKLQALKRV